MVSASQSDTTDSQSDLFAGGGEMGAIMRSIDWSQSPLGPVERWSQSLRTMVKILLANRFPLLLWWGPELCQLYNDAYRPVLGTKHPRSMGQPAADCWPEIWHIIGPLIHTPYEGGPATWVDDLFLEPNRHGFAEETHFTVAYSPVPDESAQGGIGGVLATVHEITQQVIQERRVVALRDLGARSAEAKTAEEACTIAAEVFSAYPQDVPFALLYLVDATQETARLAGVAGAAAGDSVAPSKVDLTHGDRSATGWPLAEVLQTERPHILNGLQERFHRVPPGPWTDPPTRAIVLPVPSNIAHRWAGLIVLGLSPRLELDEYYRSFCELATTQVATAIANAEAYQVERQRAEALAELDRAKTAFFSNVSHEFRTPLTLMLGPLEDTLAHADGLPAEDRERLDVAHRNSLRLLRLVNTLLDFSRIEAGRIEASYEPTDLAALTVDLASNFRSATDRASLLRLTIDCPPLSEPVYVDREMWEKIVLNLLSNAFKFTFEGEIAVRLQDAGDAVELTVLDTGTGIPPEELPHLFERFYRVQNAQGRTYEGTGIGLALVQELVKLHGGTVRVVSSLGHGASFTITIPKGAAHLPEDRIGDQRTLASTGVKASAYAEEALHWLPAGAPDTTPPSTPLDPAQLGLDILPSGDGHVALKGARRSRILLADDNADMREYLSRLLAEQHEVEAVGDGQAALTAARARRPDLVLTDLMMPALDGFGLLRALRADADLATIPVVLLSARAGEEAEIEGLEAGADEYLVKPFSARELLARVQSQLQLASVRNEAKAAAEQAAARTALLAESSQVLAEGGLEPEPMLQTLADWLAAKVGDSCAICLFSEDRQWLRPVALGDTDSGRRGLAERTMQSPRRADAPPYASLLESRTSLLMPTVDPVAYGQMLHDDRAVAERFPIHSLLFAPLHVRDEVIGTMLLLRYTPGRPFTRDDEALMQNIADRVALAIANARLYQDALRALDIRDEFLAVAAHELKTPMTGMRLTTDVFTRLVQQSSQADPRWLDLADKIKGQVVKLARLVDQLLDISRIEAGRLAIVPEDADLVEVLRAAVQGFEARGDAPPVTILAPDALPAKIDPLRIEQVLLNLLDNARKFSPRDVPIEITAERVSPSEIRVAVRDHGCGIAEEDREHIFRRFYQADGIRQGAGMGLGLHISRQIVELHGGTIDPGFPDDGGTRFTVTLPVAA